MMPNTPRLDADGYVDRAAFHRRTATIVCSTDTRGPAELALREAKPQPVEEVTAVDDSSPLAAPGRDTLAEPFQGSVATVQVLPIGRSEQVAPRWIEVRAREYTFRLAYDPTADPGRSGKRAALALSASMAQQLIGAELTENLIALYLDGRGRLLGFCWLARGSFNIVRSTVPDVASPALRLGAKGVVLVHNHPSGDPTPSRADRQHAEAIAMGLETVGVELVGSVVVAVGGWRAAWESPHHRARHTDCDVPADEACPGNDPAPDGPSLATTNPCSNPVQ